MARGGDGPGGAGGDRRARHRPARAGAGRLRRRGAAARGADRRPSWGCGGWSRRWPPGVLSALGLVVSERRRDVVESVLLGGEALTARAVGEAVARLGERGARRAGRTRRRAARRPTTCATPARRSSSPSTAPLAPEPARAARGVRPRARGALRLLGPRRRARAGDRARRGRAARAPSRRAAGAEPAERRGTRRRAVRRRVARRRACSVPARRELDGPAIFELPGSTLVVPPGWRGARRRRRGGDGAVSGLDPVTLQVMLGALRAACDEMGAVLVRSAHSANIKERRDASTALFDERGRDGHAGRAHPGAPRRDARGGRRRARRATTSPASPGSSTTPTAAAPTCRTSP